MSYTYHYQKSEDAHLQKILLEIRDFLKSSSYTGYENLINTFKKQFEYKIIGVGGCAFVAQISKTQVVRIETMDMESGYLKWLKYALKNQKLKSVPKIFAAFKFVPDFQYFSIKANPSFLVSASELLVPLQKTKVLRNYRKASNMLFKWFLEKDGKNDCLLKSFEKHFNEEHKAVFRPKEYIKIKKDVSGINDIFHKNMMVSLNSRRLVITDPIG